MASQGPPLRRLATLATTAALGAALGAVVAPASANTDRSPRATDRPVATAERAGVQELFALPAGRGSLRRVGAGYRLVLRTRGDLARFTDRPARRADSQSVRAFVESWRRNGFAADPPNAALVVARAPKGRDVVVVELTRPRVSGRTVAFRARPVRRASSGLLRFMPRADRPRPMRFGAASLFIDGAPGTVGTRLMPATLTFSNVQPGQAFGVELIAGRTPVAFSSTAGQDGPGLALNWQGAGVPLRSFEVDTTQIQVRTSAQFGAGAGTLVVTTFLAGPSEDGIFAVRATAAPGVLSTLGLGSGPPQAIGEESTTVRWSPLP